MSEKGKHLAERIIEICTLTNTRCRTVGHCDTCKVPSGNRNAKHSKEECKDWNCPEHHYQPTHKIVGGTVAKFLEQYFKNLTVPKISEAEAFYLSEEIAKAVTILSENPATPFDVVWDKIHGISSETPEGVKPGGSLPLGDKGTQQMFGELLFPSPTPETPRGNEFIAWCDEHGRETVKKVMFGHFNSKVSGFTIFFE